MKEQSPLDILHSLVSRHALCDAQFHLVAHPAVINFSQRYQNLRERLAHLSEAIAVEPMREIVISGQQLLDTSEMSLESYTDEINELVSIASLVIIPDKSPRHLALMNLHLDEYLDEKEIATSLRGVMANRRGWLVQTDRYWHVYADALLDQNEWIRWNCDFILARGLAGAPYVAYSFRRGYNLLRLNAAKTIKVRRPRVVMPLSRTPPPGGFSEETQHHGVGAQGAALAMRKHALQKRKSGEPYVIHLVEAADLAVEIRAELAKRGHSGAADLKEEEIYAAGYLHDVIEDTPTDFEDVKDAAGEAVAEWVAQLTKDKRLPESDRQRVYHETLRKAPLPVRIVKLADVLSNLREIRGVEDPAWLQTWLARRREVLSTLGSDVLSTQAASEVERLTKIWQDRLR